MRVGPDITRHRLTIRGYTSTAAEHNINFNIMTALRDAINGNPWMPQP